MLGPSCSSPSSPLDGALSQVCTQGRENPCVSAANTALASCLFVCLLPLGKDQLEVFPQVCVCWHGALVVTLVFESRTLQFSSARRVTGSGAWNVWGGNTAIHFPRENSPLLSSLSISRKKRRLGTTDSSIFVSGTSWGLQSSPGHNGSWLPCSRSAM